MRADPVLARSSAEFPFKIANVSENVRNVMEMMGLLAVIELYQATLSVRLGRGGARCRFQPTCSHYGAAVIRRHGALVGGVKTAWRILRCGPWTPAGTEDPPSD